MEEEIKKHLDEKGIEFETTHPEFSKLESPGSSVIYISDLKLAIFVDYSDKILKEMLMLESWTYMTITSNEELDNNLGNL